MAKVKISDEELQEIEAKDRHDDLIRSLKAIADNSSVDKLVTKVSALVEAVQQQKPAASQAIDLAPMTKELTASIDELKAVMEKKPTRFVVNRDEYGWITEVVPKY